ncbi:MAG: HlyD family secretion protein [Alphaproteobacteria bacterium]|nr:HlyD family secretion protein [Alphaproteobacteria bacterium]
MSNQTPNTASPVEPTTDVIPGGQATQGVADKNDNKAQIRRTPWVRRFLLVFGPLLVILISSYVYFTGGRFVSTENAYIKADKVMVAAEVSGLISEVTVKENQPVSGGDVLFRIDDRPYRIALTEAQAQVLKIRNEFASLKASYQQKQSELALARANIDYAKSEYDRQKPLVATKTISSSKFDSINHDLTVARRQEQITQQEAQQILATLGGSIDIAIDDYPPYQQAMADLDRAKLNLERTVVRAPFDGVASNTPEIGKQVVGNAASSSPVMSLIATKGVWIEANFKETDLTYVKPGQPVDIIVDTYPDQDLHGFVTSVSQGTGSEFSVIPPQNATGNWVKVVQRIPVRISIPNDEAKLALRSGMSTSVEIDTGHQRDMPNIVHSALSWLGGLPQATAAETEQPK